MMQYGHASATGHGASATGRAAAAGRWLAWMLALALVLFARPAAALTEDDFLPPEQAFVFSAAMADPATLVLNYRIAPEYYMYRERFGLSASPAQAVTLGEAAYPQGKVKYDPTFDKDMEVFYGTVAVRVPLSQGNGQPFTLTVTSQGCADAGLCYPPMDNTVQLTPVTGGYALAAGTASAPQGGGTGPPRRWTIRCS
ncbi:disulfide bond corrector protein DsbC [Bordetella pertussis STO1-CHOC-0018]|nr:disulfide bond corrector protein DsbC [Bordetella pertussis STO1-CHOC-0018]